MTVVAYDGTRLAADKRGIVASACYTVTKVHRRRGFRIGISGSITHGLAVAEWIEAGAVIADYPKAEKEDVSYCLVVHDDGRVLRYEGTPWAVPIEDRFAAIGSGRDYALAAMYLGYDAIEAVKVASAFSCDCGNGVDILFAEDAPGV